MQEDPSLRDEQLETEIRLVGDLVLAASQCEGPLSQEAIDEILGLDDETMDADHVTGRGARPGEALPPGARAS
jgi:hypothetical protein